MKEQIKSGSEQPGGARRAHALDRRSGGFPAGKSGTERKSLRQEVLEIDQDILKLLLRRSNLLEKMKHKGRIDPAEERTLREAWQSGVAKVSHDAELSGHFFSLMQNVSFLPKPLANRDGDAPIPGSQRRNAFNLAPARSPLEFSMVAPLDSYATRAWLYLAAASGSAMRLAPSLQSDSVVDCVKAFVQAGASLTRDDMAITARQGVSMGYPDRVIHVGGGEFNFYLLLAHYLGRPSRVKFTGETTLKLADFSAIRRFMPAFGARLVHMVPKNNGLPVRLECSGILPPVIEAGPELPGRFVEALLLAAGFYETPFAVDLSRHEEKEVIFAHALNILEAAGVTFAVNGWSVNIEPSCPSIPYEPQLPMDLELACFLLALAAPLGGHVELKGIWPEWPESGRSWELAASLGLGWRKDGTSVHVCNNAPIAAFDLAGIQESLLRQCSGWQLSLLAALAACATLNGADVKLPEIFGDCPEAVDFLRGAGLYISADGKLVSAPGEGGPVWNAPAPSWAIALAVAACARKGNSGFQLGNPGIITELWPAFWACYNSLPKPNFERQDKSWETRPKSRRRILTGVVAVPPAIHEDDTVELK